MPRTSPILIGLVAIVAAACLALAGVLLLREPTPTVDPVGSSRTGLAVARIGVPRVGDCGDHRRGTVTTIECSDPAADVVLAERLVLGDPQTLCPLFDRKSVIATAAGESLTLCWVPQGGGPERRFGPAKLRTASTGEPQFGLGTCGDVHDQHVHAPLACDDSRADGVVVQVLEPGTDASACQPETVLVLQASDGRWVCWAQSSA